MASAQASQSVLACSNRMEQALILPRPSRFNYTTKPNYTNANRRSFTFRRPLATITTHENSPADTSTAHHQLQQQQQTKTVSPFPSPTTSLSILDDWDPFRMGTRSLRQMMNVMDKLFGEIYAPNMDLSYLRVPWDVVEDDASYQMRIDLPGFGKDEVKVHIEDGVLFVNAHRNKEDSDQQGKRSLRTHGSYCTKIALPKNVELNNLSAKLNNGVLEIYIPKVKIEKQLIDVKLE